MRDVCVCMPAQMCMCVCVCSGIWDTQAGNELLRTRALCLPETFGILIISQERRVKIDSTVWKKQQLTRRDVTAHSAGSSGNTLDI